ncbi:MAG: hypothetical protein HFJ26_06935 [Clostridia bacterium]|nr:hypothetical protein [Clostridia bacterium]
MFMIAIISIAIYLIAILMISTNIYEFQKEQKRNFIIIGVFAILIFTWMIVAFSSNGIQVSEGNFLKTAKMVSILLFAPINTIFVLPYLGNVLNKYKQERIKEEQVRKRLLILAVALLLVIIVEVNYIKTFEIGLLSSVIK